MASTARPAPLACLQCRSKHLKCNGGQPVCARCATTGSECVYIRSRRGFRGRGRNGSNTPNVSVQSGSHEVDSSGGGLHMPSANDSPSQLSNETMSLPEHSHADHQHPGQTAVPGAIDSLVDQYYAYFHAAHPFMVPRKAIFSGVVQIPHHLRSALSYIGAHYNPGFMQTGAPFDTQILETAPDDHFKVQSWLLFALASFSRLDCQVGAAALRHSIEMAKQIGLDQEAYCNLQPPLIAESCRRTWWELYVVATLVRSMMGVDIQIDLDRCDLRIPTYCDTYKRCELVPRELGTLQEMQARFFSDVDFVWTPCSYKIEATRILRLVLETDQPNQAHYDACQAAISSWWLSLPEAERMGPNKRNGDIDECMFFAMMIINMASLRINLPRSNLGPSWKAATLCQNFGTVASTKDATYHTATALKAANSLSGLIASEGSTKLHSPCSACAVAFGSIVQLPAYLQEPDQIKAEALKENIQLGLSYLKRLGEVWPLASAVRAQLAALAKDVLIMPRHRDSNSARRNSDATSKDSDPMSRSLDPTLQPMTSQAGDQWLEFARENLTGASSFSSPPMTWAEQTPFDANLEDAWLQDLITAPPVDMPIDGISVDGMDGMNGMNGMNGMSGMSGMSDQAWSIPS